MPRIYDVEDVIKDDGSSCGGVRDDFRHCILESDCVKIDKMLPSECMKRKLVSEECFQLRELLFECKRSLVRMIPFSVTPVTHLQHLPDVFDNLFILGCCSWTIDSDFVGVKDTKQQMEKTCLVWDGNHEPTHTLHNGHITSQSSPQAFDQRYSHFLKDPLLTSDQ